MSAHNKQGVVAAKSTGIVVSDGRHRPSHRVRAIILGAACLLVLLGVAALTYVLVAKRPVSSKNPSKSGVAITPYNQAQAYGQANELSKAQSLLDQQLSTAKTPAAKVLIYNQKMTIALNAKQYNDVFTLGAQADKTLPTSNTAQIVYQAYLEEGDKTNAKIWLQHAIDRLDKSSPTYESNADELYHQLSELQ